MKNLREKRVCDCCFQKEMFSYGVLKKRKSICKQVSLIFLSISMAYVRLYLILESLFSGVREEELIKERKKMYLTCCDDNK